MANEQESDIIKDQPQSQDSQPLDSPTPAEEPISSNKRIAKNTIFLYFRMLITMAVGLYTSRVVLNTLGVEDYGINSVVGGVVGLMGIVTSLLSQGTTRFITIALGKNDIEELKSTLSASFTIHVVLALLILVIGEAVGPLIIFNLNIDPTRMNSAQFVFQMSLISAIIGIIMSPLMASIIAHEKMKLYAYISIWDVIAKLIIVYLLQLVDFDKLKLYSFLYLCVNLITTLIYFVYCRYSFSECRNIQFKPNINLYKSIFKYTGWNAIGACAFTLNAQGITILLNAFGTVVNAARGIAGSISTYCFGFVSNFQTATRPQITKLYAVGNVNSMNNLIVRTSKFSAYLMAFISVPLFIEMEYVLTLWLKNVPTYTVTFARLTLIQGFIQAIDFPIGSGIHAVGKMMLPNITSAFIYMMILPISYIAIQFGATPVITYIIVVCIYPLAMFMDLYIIHKYTQFQVWHFIKQVILKTTIFIGFTYIIVQVTIVNYFNSDLFRLLLTVIISAILFLSIIYIFGLNKDEQMFIKKIIFDKFYKK